MTLQIDGMDVMAIAQAATVVGGIISMLVIGLLIYLVVRPRRHVREARRNPPAIEQSDVEEVVALMDRMEARLGVLERLVGMEAALRLPPDHQRLLEPAEEGRENRRTK